MKDEIYKTKLAVPSASTTEMMETNPKWKHLFAFTTRRHLPYLVGGGLSSAGAAALRTVLAIILGRVFDVVAAFGNGQKSGVEALSDVSRYCVILAALGVAQWVVNSLFLAIWIVFGEAQASAVRDIIFKGLLTMGKAWFDSLPDGTTGLVASIQRKTNELQVATSQVFGYWLADLLTALGSLIVAFYTSRRLTLVLLSTLPVSIAVIAFTGQKIQPAIKMQTSYLDSASKFLAGSLGGIDIVKMCNAYSHETNNYMAQIKHAAMQYRHQARFNSIQIGYIRFWAVAIFVVGFWYGLVLVQKGERPGQILTTFYSVLAALQGIESLLPNWLVFEKGMSAGQVLQALKAEVAYSADDRGSVRPDYFVGTIDLKEVNFSYPTTPTITRLERCTLSIAGGESTFLVGHSGSGKSTVAQLITRVYDTADGSIYIDGWPIKTLQPKWIQQHIMLVEQMPVIFSDTLFRNIMLGHRNPDSVENQQVLEACRIFGLESTIASIPGGLHAAIGGKGCPLSVGQRQRIVLARAYLRDPAILVLDEPTSALDQSSRESIMQEIRKWRKGKTTVFISHDLAGIKENDFAYVLDNGSVIEQGLKQALELNPHSIFYLASLGEKELDNTAQIEINIIPPPADDTVPESKRHSRAPPTSKSFLMSQSNSARYSTGSFLSPRISMFSVGIRPVDAGMVVRPTYVPVTNTDRADQSQPIKHLQVPLVSRATSFINRQFQSTPWRSSFGLNVHNPPTSSPHSSPSSVPLSAGTGLPKHTPERKRRVVNLGVLPKKSNNMSNLSFFQILQTVIPCLNAKAVALFAVGIVATVVGALTTPAFSFCLAKLLAAMWSAGDKSDEGKRWALYLVAIAFVDGVFSGTGHYLLESSAQSWVDALRRSTSRSILRQPKSWFMDDKNSHARIIETLDVHCEEMRNALGRFVPIILSVTAMVFASVVWALIISWKLSLVALAPLPLVIAALKGYTYLGDMWETRCANGVEETGTILGEVLASIRTIRNYTLENYFISKYTRSNNSCLGLGFRRALYTCPLFGLYQAFSYGLTALLFYYGTSLLADDATLSVGKILQVMNLLLFSITSATELLSAMPQITMTTASASRVLAYTQLPEGEPEHKADRWFQGFRPSPLPIRMRDLSFTYPGKTDNKNGTLTHFNLDILPGQCTAIVGPSGSGKSTILSLLLRLQKPTPLFSLTYAGKPCSAVHPQQQQRQLRDAMGYVPQTPFLFPATIRANILYGLDPSSPLCHDTHVRAAARDARIDEYIMSLPAGYDTVVGEGGTALSGGQAQRVTIARALVRRPALLVMDEPTSALDAENARLIRACVVNLVARWKKERRPAAVVVVTHSVDMMRAADTIAVVENGRNVEQGTFGDLWFNGDAFRRLIGRKDGGRV